MPATTTATRPPLGLLLAVALSIAPALQAGPREQAKLIHDRIAGVPPDAPTLDAMAADIQAGDVNAAAMRAMQHSGFYNVTLKNWVTPWTNEEQTVFAPLNDYTATVVGMVRDDKPFNQILFADILYVGGGNLGLPAYSMDDNAHYQAMEDRGLDLQSVLQETTQSALTDLPTTATAGVMTTRAAAKAFFVDGTNRAMLRFTVLNHLCTDLEQIKDGSRPTDRIRQDVSRSPGGDSRIFLNNCVGCHAGLDPLAQAFAHYNYQYDADADPDAASGRIVYTAPGVQPKYLINADNFKPGFVTESDHWTNYWREGPNRSLGWSGSPLPIDQARGAKSLGRELAGSQAFASCQATKVFRAVCLRDPGDAPDRAKVTAMAGNFIAGNYNLKQVFAEAADYCKGN